MGVLFLLWVTNAPALFSTNRVAALVEGFLCLHLSSLHSRKMISSLKYVRNRVILWFDIPDTGHGNGIMAENQSLLP